MSGGFEGAIKGALWVYLPKIRTDTPVTESLQEGERSPDKAPGERGQTVNHTRGIISGLPALGVVFLRRVTFRKEMQVGLASLQQKPQAMTRRDQ